MSYEIFSYGNGQALSDLLNGVASIVGEDSYKSLINMGIMFGFGLLAISTVFDIKFGRIGKWYVIIMAIYTGLLVPKVDVLITDPVMRQSQYAVSNVPIGLAYILSTITTIEYNLTNAVETALHVPEDLTYNSTGMLMASDMVRKASSFKILDQSFANNIRAYLQQCVQYDILHGKYTVNELFSAGDIWKFTKEYNSPARAFMYNGDIVTCRSGSEMLEQDWAKELDTSMYIFGKRLFGSYSEANPAQLLSKYLSAGYGYLGDISNTASKIMQQNMMINAYHDSVISNAAELGAAAAVESYAVARATQNSRSAYKVSGEVAGRQLPYLKNVIQMLLIGAFVVILPLFFFPSGLMRIKHFIEILASLSLWAPLYAILNLQMTNAGRWKIIGLTSQTEATEHAAITIANLPGIEQIAADQAILAGYLALSIPLISYGLIKSSMHAFTSLASGVMNVAQSSAGHAAEEATTGNYSLGNVSLENTNAYNSSAFHDDGNVRISSGAISVQDLNGSMNTIFGNGDTKTDQSEGISKMSVHTDFASRLGSSLSKSYNENISEAQSSAVDLSNSTAAALHDTYELAKAVGNSTSSDASKSMGYSTSEVQALSEYKNAVDRVVEQTGASENEIFSAAASASISTKGLPFGIGAGLSSTATNDASTNHQNTLSQEISNTTGFSNTMDSAMRVAADNSHRTTSDESTRLSDSVRANLDSAETLRENISANLSEAESKQEAISFVKDNSAAINTTGDQMVFKELRNTINPETGRNYSPHDVSELGINNPLKLQAIIEPLVEKNAQSIIAKGGIIDEKGEHIAGSYKKNSQAIKEGAQLTEKHADNKQVIKDQDGLKRVDSSIDTKVDAKLKVSEKTISGSKDHFVEKDTDMRVKTAEELDSSLAVKAGASALKRVKDPLLDAIGTIKDTFNANDK